MDCRPPPHLGKGTSLSQLITHFVAAEPSCSRGELAAYRNKPLRTAIAMAARADRGDGQRHDHQWSLRDDTARKAEVILLKAADQIKACKDFDALHSLVKIKLNIPGAAEMYWYDTAFRIGISMGILPEKVYLHRGTRLGAEQLGLGRGKPTLEMSELPPALQALEPYQVEDFLCIYHDALAHLAHSAESARRRRS